MKKMFDSKFSHGGDIWQVAEKYEILPDDVIDFSANINPWGVSLEVVKAVKKRLDVIFRYPDPECRRLTGILSQMLRLNQKNILIGNGATEIIYLVMEALKPARVIVPCPTFTEYERAIKLAGGRVKYLYLKEENNFTLEVGRLIKEAKDAGMILLCNPNNPTGTILSRDKLCEVAHMSKKLGKFLVVDESFIDFQPECSILDEVRKNSSLVILRSFTKFFSIAGLRLGYGVSSREVIEKMKSFKQPWTVNCLAQVAGVHILQNMKKAEEMKEKLIKERDFLYKNLCKIEGIKPYPSQANFILIKIKKASFSSSKLTEELIKRGILVRDCCNFPGLSDKFIRVAVRKREDNRKLIHHLSQILGG